MLPEDLCVCGTIDAESSRINVSTERRKWEKIYTIISGFEKNINLKDIAKKLKKKLACGGTVEITNISLQGDHRGVITDVLVGLGFSKDRINIDWKM